jgi:hypothetical protein
MSDEEPKGNQMCMCRAPEKTPGILVRGEGGIYWMCPWCEIPDGCVMMPVPDEDE